MKIGIFLPNATFDLPGSPEVGELRRFPSRSARPCRSLGTRWCFLAPTKRGTHASHDDHDPGTESLLETKSIPDIGTRFQRWSSDCTLPGLRGTPGHGIAAISSCWPSPSTGPSPGFGNGARPELKTIMDFRALTFLPEIDFFTARSMRRLRSGPRSRSWPRNAWAANRCLFRIRSIIRSFVPHRSSLLKRIAHGKLVASGRFVGWKGFSNLIKAMARLRDHHQIDVHLSIAGEGPERKNLEAQIHRLDLDERVRLCGRLEATALAK